ncbi:dienelactone hydrolase family protein [Serratia sp. UGAL515B_01]|uniref:dienelactone hydrolase family protein n=1 Tax=Serratia sp. UGAL515B_01 TaxID=2986763 RepID=UPI0029530CCC|nr:dienelactone hydrolase family protein [Serratia sp. UGAL515B_01]WON77188.1 dienelactone hydrolase family protein [Serratia sp. UGAL515B_01]
MKTEPEMMLNKAKEGFTPAVAPLAASTILTDEHDIHVGETTIPSQGEDLPAYIAKPANHPGPLPVILVVQEIFGVHEHIQDLCRRLAKQGYMAIAPELYFRQGDARDFSDIGELLKKLVSHVPDNQVLADLDHTAHWATRHGGDASKLAITGFCWGGRITWLYAAHNPQLKAAVTWYGKLVGEKTLNTPKHPVDIATHLSAPVLGLYGGQDASIPMDTVETMRQAIRAANADAEIVVYPEADHAFHADYRPSYNAEASTDGWQRMLSWFTQHGVVGVK